MKDRLRFQMLGVGIALAVLGFVSTVSQVMLMRELVATFYGNELLYGLALMAWLVWGAVGAWGIGSRLVRRTDLSLSVFAVGIGAIAPLFIAQMTVLRGIRTILGTTPGAYVDFGNTVLTVLLIPALFCPLAGLLFTLGARLVLKCHGTAGHAYFFESCGAVVGGLLVSFVFIPTLNAFQVILCLGGLALISALYLIWDGQGHAKFLLPLLAVALGIAALAGGTVLDRWTLGWQWRDVVSYTESPYGRLTVQARDGQRIFYTNGLLSFETQSTFPEEVAHFPLLAHPHPHRVLLIGGGMAGNLREILKHPVHQVVYVELDPQLIMMAQAHLPPSEAAVLEDARVRLVLSDGRHYVANVAEHSFDVIILDLPPPTTGSLNRFYTREFFAQVRRALRPDGLFALGLPSAENYWSPELTRRNLSIYETLHRIFPTLLALTSGDHLFFLATSGSFPIDAAAMAARLTARAIQTRHVTPFYIEYIFSNDRFHADRQRLASGRAVRLNEDLVPICYYYDLALWLSRFYPAVGELFERAGLVNLVWLSCPWALMVLLARYQRRWAVPMAIASVGLAHMMLQVVILIAFQTEHGTVYSGVGMLVTAFMAGLALGSALGNRLTRCWEDRGAIQISRLSSSREMASRPLRVGLMGIQVGVIGLSGLVFGLLWLPYEIPAVAFGMLAAAAGCITGAAFPLAMLALGEHTAGAAGWLYGADLIGGALGAGIGATLLLPLLGIPQVCAFTALVGIAGLLCLL
ncbi:MAG: methyltransferase domain-containing protein [Anaerolineae bacterium]|nr:methyltransferase domain-containing protein [Anaerolineae bacterium]MDW8070444.1 methyltransferase domain-containing protein [Anaerolineae bacterium]